MTTDWNPDAYGRFGDLRLRPALDLLAAVGRLPPGDVIDLGCGAGAAGPALALRMAGRSCEGVDLSPAMLASAQATGSYARLTLADIADWRPATAPALIFSNAALQWLPDHTRLIPGLATLLAPGGTLAVQMPRQHGAASHRFLRDIAAGLFPDRFDMSGWAPPVATAEVYHRLLAPLGDVQVWESEYLQVLSAQDGVHPVAAFTGSTAMRPYAEKMTAPEAAHFTAAYSEALAAAYPPEPDGTVLFPFRRLFFTLVRPQADRPHERPLPSGHHSSTATATPQASPMAKPALTSTNAAPMPRPPRPD